MRKKHQTQTPHYGVAHQMVRQGRTVQISESEYKSFDSIRRAKRFMRTGKEDRS